MAKKPQVPVQAIFDLVLGYCFKVSTFVEANPTPAELALIRKGFDGVFNSPVFFMEVFSMSFNKEFELACVRESDRLRIAEK
jgi:hypothetical protein